MQNTYSDTTRLRNLKISSATKLITAQSLDVSPKERITIYYFQCKCIYKNSFLMKPSTSNNKLKSSSTTCHRVGRDGALVEAITLNRRVVGSTPALAVT